MKKYEELKEYLNKNQKTWLITGVAGFIGSNLLEKLLILNQKVVGLDNFETGYQYNTGNFDDMLDKIYKLMRIDKKSYNKMCKNAQTRYKKYFKINIMMKKIENIYNSASNG